mgnify:FL=1
MDEKKKEELTDKLKQNSEQDDLTSLIPSDDLDYEREEARKRHEAEAVRQKREQEEKEREKREREQHEKELQQQKIELVKLKQGMTSDTIKEEGPHERKKLSFGEWLSNVWYRSKWLILFVAVLIFAFGYITYDTIIRTKPDLTVLVLSDTNALYVRTPELEEFFESYCDDINGDGEVEVLIYNISTDYSDPATASSYQAQLMTQLQQGENMIVISDGTSDFAVHDFTSELEGDCVTPLGIRLKCPLTTEELKWEAMPDELYMGLREPARLLSTEESEMEKNYEEALPTYMRIYEAIYDSLYGESGESSDDAAESADSSGDDGQEQDASQTDAAN